MPSPLVVAAKETKKETTGHKGCLPYIRKHVLPILEPLVSGSMSSNRLPLVSKAQVLGDAMVVDATSEPTNRCNERCIIHRDDLLVLVHSKHIWTPFQKATNIQQHVWQCRHVKKHRCGQIGKLWMLLACFLISGIMWGCGRILETLVPSDEGELQGKYPTYWIVIMDDTCIAHSSQFTFCRHWSSHNHYQ